MVRFRNCCNANKCDIDVEPVQRDDVNHNIEFSGGIADNTITKLFFNVMRSIGIFDSIIILILIIHNTKVTKHRCRFYTS